MFEVHFFLILCFILKINCKKFEGFVVGGELAPIEEYPHSAYLSMVCTDIDSRMCGGSILNQDIILTAAHCLHSCNSIRKPLRSILISIGSSHKRKGIQKIKAHTFIVHDKFDSKTDENDIALIRVKTRIIFGTTIKRVAIMETPPAFIYAQMAGWGIIDDFNNVISFDLYKLRQVFWKKSDCEKIYGNIPDGSFCASSQKSESYVAGGDSGSALVINNYIEVGFVSFKIPIISKTLIVYSNVSYFHNWITYNSRKLCCEDPIFILQ